MKERPILFSDPMVKAILDGRKTMTRRVVPERFLDKYYDYDDWCNSVMPSGADFSCSRSYEKEYFMERCPYGHPGDRLWVRETHIITEEPRCPVVYKADTEVTIPPEVWRPSIHMPRWASRITLEITDVRVERLQDISVEDCQREGVESNVSSLIEFHDLWDSINGKKHPWVSNPWVWVVSFKRI